MEFRSAGVADAVCCAFVRAFGRMAAGCTGALFKAMPFKDHSVFRSGSLEAVTAIHTAYQQRAGSFRLMIFFIQRMIRARIIDDIRFVRFMVGPAAAAADAMIGIRGIIDIVMGVFHAYAASAGILCIDMIAHEILAAPFACAAIGLEFVGLFNFYDFGRIAETQKIIRENQAAIQAAFIIHHSAPIDMDVFIFSDECAAIPVYIGKYLIVFMRTAGNIAAFHALGL